jgi:hypothetical protein
MLKHNKYLTTYLALLHHIIKLVCFLWDGDRGNMGSCIDLDFAENRLWFIVNSNHIWNRLDICKQVYGTEI